MLVVRVGAWLETLVAMTWRETLATPVAKAWRETLATPAQAAHAGNTSARPTMMDCNNDGEDGGEDDGSTMMGCDYPLNRVCGSISSTK